MQSELKPCPFCGSDRLMVLPPTCDRNTPYSAADRAYPVVRCSGCYTDVPGRDFDASSKSAVEAWNRRSLTAALSDKQAVEVKELEGWELVPKSAIMWLIGAGPDAYGNWFDKPDDAPAFWWRTHFNKLRADAAKIRSALVDVPAVETVADDVLEAAAEAAFRQAQSVYRGDYDHFPLRSTWQTTDESVRDGWRKIAAAALSHGRLNASKLNEIDIATAVAPYLEQDFSAWDVARAVLRLLISKTDLRGERS